MNIRIITIVAFLFTLLSCGGAEERQSFYIDKAKSSLEARDYEKAKIDLKNVLQIDPRNSEAKYLFGTIFEQQGNYAAAYKQYTAAIEYNENNIDARYRLATIYLQASQLDKVDEQIEKIEVISPNHVYVQSLKAAIQFRNDNFEEAIKLLSSIDRTDMSENMYELYAASVYKQGDVNKSISILEEAVEKYSYNIKLNMLLASIYEFSGNKEKAELVYKINLESNGVKNIRQYVELSNFYGRNNDLEKAYDVYVQLTKSEPENEDYQLLQVSYIEQKQGVEKAIEHLKSLVNTYPKQQSYKVSLANLYIKNKNNAEAIAITKRIIEDNYSDKSIVSARNILAALALESNDINAAENELAKIQEINPNDVMANFMIGKISLSRKNYDEAVKSFRVVVRESPENEAAYVYLAKAHEHQGSIDLAREVLAQGFYRAPKNIEIATSFVELLLKNGEYEHALNLLKSFPSNDVATLRVLNLKAKVYFANKKYSESLKHAKMLIASYPEFDDGYLTAAGSYMQLNQPEEASRVLRQGLDSKSSPKLLIGYANVEQKLNRVDKLIAYLESHQEYKPIVFNLLAELHASSNRVEKAEYYYKQSISLNPEWDVPYAALAKLYGSKDNFQGAIEILDAGIKSVEDVNKLKLMQADIYLSIGDTQRAIELYQQILEHEPSHVIAANNLAITLVDNFDDKDQLERAYNLVKGFENHSSPLVLDTVGWVYARSGRSSDAVSILSGLVKQHPDVPVFRYHLGMAYYYNNDVDNAYDTLNVFQGKNISNEIWSDNIKKVADEYENIHSPKG